MMFKKTVLVSMAIATLLQASLGEACTAVYIGRKVSADGSTIIGRSEDLSSFSAYNKMFTVVPRVENKPGRVFRDANGFSTPLPATTFKYTTLSNGGSSSPHSYPAVYTNENSVSITATVDAYVKKEAVKADPYVYSGMREDSMAEALIQGATTARGAVEHLGRLMDTKGVTEAYVVFIADQKETWMVELYTGHQWVAVKLPEDKALVMGNQFMADTLENIPQKDILHSAKAFTLPYERGFAVEEKGKLHLGKTYGRKFFTYNNGRSWIGQKLLAPKTTDAKYNENKLYPFLFSPDKKVNVKEVMEIYRNRYEGTNLDTDLPKNKGVRVIGTDKQQEVHILQIKDKMPKENSAVQWLCLGPAEHSVFVPTFSDITETSWSYRVNAKQYSPQSAYWRFQRVSAKGNANRNNNTGKHIRQEYSKLEDKYIQNLVLVEKRLAKLYKKDKNRAKEYAQYSSLNFEQEALKKVNNLSK